MDEAENKIEETDEETNGDSGFQKYIVLATIFLIIAIFLPFICGLIIAVVSSDSQQTLETIKVIRDVFMISVFLEGMLIVIALVLLVLQVTRLVVILNNEISPVVTDVRETIGTLKGTVRFVGRNLVEPIIAFKSFVSGALMFFREVGGIRRAIRRTENVENENEETAET